MDDLVRSQDEEGQGLEAILHWLISYHVCMFLVIATAQRGGNRPQTKDSTDTSRGGLTASESGMMPQRGRHASTTGTGRIALRRLDADDRVRVGSCSRSSYAPDRPRTRGQGSD